MAQLGHKNHLCAWSCAGFGNKDKHDQTARTRLRKLHRFNMFDRKLNMYSLVLHGKKWLRCARYINASCPMYGATTAIGASYFHLHVLCWIRACMFFSMFTLLWGSFSTFVCVILTFLLQKMAQLTISCFNDAISQKPFNTFNCTANGADKQHPNPEISNRTNMHPWWQNRQTAGEKEGKHGAESTPQFSLNLSNTICACG